MAKSVKGLANSIHFGAVKPLPKIQRPACIGEPLEKSVERYAAAHARLKKRKSGKRQERLNQFMANLENFKF